MTGSPFFFALICFHFPTFALATHGDAAPICSQSDSCSTTQSSPLLQTSKTKVGGGVPRLSDSNVPPYVHSTTWWWGTPGESCDMFCRELLQDACKAKGLPFPFDDEPCSHLKRVSISSEEAFKEVLPQVRNTAKPCLSFQVADGPPWNSNSRRVAPHNNLDGTCMYNKGGLSDCLNLFENIPDTASLLCPCTEPLRCGTWCIDSEVNLPSCPPTPAPPTPAPTCDPNRCDDGCYNGKFEANATLNGGDSEHWDYTCYDCYQCQGCQECVTRPLCQNHCHKTADGWGASGWKCQSNQCARCKECPTPNPTPAYDRLFDRYMTKIGRGGCESLIDHGNGYGDEASVQRRCDDLPDCAFYTWSNDDSDGLGGAWFCSDDNYEGVNNAAQFPKWKVGYPAKVGYISKVGRGDCEAIAEHSNGYKDEASVQQRCNDLADCAYYTWSNDDSDALGGAWFCKVDHYQAVNNAAQYPKWKVGHPEVVG